MTSKKEIAKDPAREERIDDEIIVDAYDEEERYTGWYTYLQETITFPFKAQVIKKSGKSPLHENEIVTVLDMGDFNDYESAMYVQVTWGDRTFSVPLDQLYPIDADERTIEAVEDWHYWVARGYCV
jgi:hypothetical protein